MCCRKEILLSPTRQGFWNATGGSYVLDHDLFPKQQRAQKCEKSVKGSWVGGTMEEALRVNSSQEVPTPSILSAPYQLCQAFNLPGDIPVFPAWDRGRDKHAPLCKGRGRQGPPPHQRAPYRVAVSFGGPRAEGQSADGTTWLRASQIAAWGEE
ncbi:hypothetical protein NQZ68_013694 [Dissostichus eleginoides]|nr:hypothetical protein NQZ68_013694 [Dissostichus eleginoides]